VENGHGGYLKMSNFVKELANKEYTYLPYLWILRLKIKGMYPSLINGSKQQRCGRNAFINGKCKRI
jgi:hypothetical protein